MLLHYNNIYVAEQYILYLYYKLILPKFTPINNRMNQILVWNSSFEYYFELAKQNGVDLFDGCDVIHGPMPDNIAQDPRKKVAVVDWFYYQNKNYDLSWADLVICFTRELITHQWSVYLERTQKHFNCKKIIAVVGGVNYNHKHTFPENAVYYPALCFLHYVVDCNEPVNYTLGSRPYLFDALLGGKKPFRKYIFKKLRDTNLLDSSIVSLTSGPYDHNYSEFNYVIDGPSDLPDYSSPALAELEDPDVQLFKQTSADTYSANTLSNKTFKGSKNYSPSMSFMVPHEIYRNSWYSIVSETNIGSIDFITEKTAKCLFGKRIFVCFGSKGHMEFLQQQGFKTFNGIVDESYDTVDDPVTRLRMAWEQVEFLASSDPAQLYEKAKDILDHNYQLINNHRVHMEPVKKFISTHLSRL